ncbi:L,D-transpeptidase-like protein [Amycolatopsis sulphurea]|uniref:L,D-transpeptidase-like protein n=1 Tax=Amycolatopsis sulphurea TaxID=76022 RepID=A0A2A9G3Q4_9PSEU|nr:L,D-transpeptidase [Amycolatopsis sulphurea]PFG57365.1 L,D-transpeptidase-like protein [Amycolatopsis sulphurea]
MRDRKITAVLAAAVATVAAAATIGFAGTAEAAGAPCSARAKACVKLSANKAWLMKGGKVVRGAVPVTVGRPGHLTPEGSFTVQWKDLHHHSKEYNAPMPYSVFFTTTGVAFHEGSLNVQSHGCVHLSHEDAVAFFDYLRPSDVVEVVR